MRIVARRLRSPPLRIRSRPLSTQRSPDEESEGAAASHPPPPPPPPPPLAEPPPTVSAALRPRDEDGIAARCSKALQTGSVGGVIQRLSDSFELPVLLQRYGKNLLSHGVEFLRGDDDLPIFVAGARGLPQWYPLPDEEALSHSTATLHQTEHGTLLLSGMHARSSGGARRLLEGARAADAASSRLGGGACGMGSSARWLWDLSQHHWLEVTLRTDGRPYELVLQAEASASDSHWTFRAPLPAGPRPAAAAGGRAAAAGGPYAVLGVDPDASAEEVRAAYVSLAKEAHPDGGGSEERFQVLSRAYALLADAEARERYDSLGVGDFGDEGGHECLLGEWFTFKLPFSAFRNRGLYQLNEGVAHMYVLLADGEEGPFRLELGAITAGRCENGGLPSAGFYGESRCELGHCACGYYNGWRVEAFDGPLRPDQLPASTEQLMYGFGHHHLDDDEKNW